MDYIPENIEERIFDRYKEYLQEDIELMASKRFYKVDDITYRSLLECSRATGVPCGTVKSRLESNNFLNYEYV